MRKDITIEAQPRTLRGKNEARRLRSYRTCWLPAEAPISYTAPRESGAYVPETAARLDDDRNLSDGARRCARKIAQ